MLDKGLTEFEVKFIYELLEKSFPILISQQLTGDTLKTATVDLVAALKAGITSLKIHSTQ